MRGDLHNADLRRLRVAVVHDWLTAYAGSEKVLEQLLLLFPQAEIFTLVDHLPESDRAFLRGHSVKTSFLQRLPWSAKTFRMAPWLFPAAVESFDMTGFDLVLSSSHAVAKGVLTGPDQLHICYCHSPIRYAWDCQHEYLRRAGLENGIRGLYARLALHYLRLWDVRTTHGVDHFIANSNFIARRIGKTYGRTATVIHPPVAIDKFPLVSRKADYYATHSRLVPYKRVDLIVEAFRQLPGRRLLVIGDGPEMKACRKLAGTNVELLGYQPDERLRDLLGQARAYIFAAEEDFGISPVEAQACGTPAICYGKGGVLDSVIDGRTGLYFAEQSADSIAEAVRRFEAAPDAFNPAEIRGQAERFAPAGFRDRTRRFVAERWREHWMRLHGAQSPAEGAWAMSA